MRLNYIDSLKGIGAFIVFFCHFNGLFNMVSIPKWLQIFSNGEFAVVMFLMLSGFSISLSLERNNTIDKIRSTILSRYMRFAIPMAFVTVVSYFIYLCGGYYNNAVALFENQGFGCGIFEDVSLANFIFSLIFSPMGYDSLNTPVWMMKYIFEGTFVIIILNLGVSKLKFVKQIAVLLFASFLLLLESIYLSDVIAGMIIFKIWNKYKDTDVFSNGYYKYARIVILFVFICSAYLIGDLYTRKDGEIGIFPSLMLMLANIMMIISVLFSCLLQKILNIRCFNILGSVSFEFYLLHWIVICSISSYLWIFFAESYLHEYQWLVWSHFVFTTLVVLLLSIIIRDYLTPRFFKPLENRLMELVRE